ncbi:uncharacterized protein MELLADRAFT_63130 [Melampsora larici-populina 98AG31]|uniref:Uncharacterized protein n=1 Tax=Melampsora larici-populina (strain 98AG31 / pathotype 3-4-7) TaxID=747676 RepID=F4RLI8_MELLP|nr:uncharacterized protein MELLADRAFT_63130 [Melampsora larici-populina 98AG31]EGG06745.1 hypothetical protein MELLADRAFT_63130 [Melampsora larici-populina 98AG31]
MPPKTGISIKGNDQPVEKKQASPGPDELEAYQEYIASKEECTPASPDPEELEAYQAYLDSQVENIPGTFHFHYMFGNSILTLMPPYRCIQTERRFSSAEPEEVEAVIDFLKSELGPSMMDIPEAPSECGSYDSVTNRRRPFCYAYHGLWESGYCKYCQDTPEDRSMEEAEDDKTNAREGSQEQ